MRPVHRLVLLAVFAMLAGCQRQLIPTPNLYIHAQENPFADVPPELRTSSVDLLYLTDRARKGGDADSVKYGYERSRSLAFGSFVVEIGNDVSWEVLVKASRTEKRNVAPPLRVRSVTELGRFLDTPGPIINEGGVVKLDSDYLAGQHAVIDALYEEISRRLALTPRKDAFLFVHGYGNTLKEAAFRMAELWHFLGREGVPIVYSWPAGAPGLLRGYTTDRESGEFTQFHLKELLRILATCPELETIHIIAHSRGTDVAMTALRELIIVARAKGEHPQSALKLGHVVLAAPDVDADVSSQRFGAERLYDGFRRATIYVTKNDRALGHAEWLFGSKKRIGKFRPDKFDEAARERFEQIPNVDIVDSLVKTDYWGHGYFLSDPATCSDLILFLRYERAAGAANGRPLTELIPAYYILDENYPQQAAPLPKKYR